MLKYTIFIIAVLFVTLFSCILPIQGQPIWYGQYIGLLFCMFLGITIALWDFNKFLSLFYGLCICSTFFITQINPRAIIILTQLGFACLASYGISRLSGRYRRYILWGIFGLMLLQSLWLLLQAFNVPIKITFMGQKMDITFVSIYDYKAKELVGFSGAKDQLGSFFGLTLPIIAYLQSFFIPLSIAGLMISKSSFAFISALMGILLYLWFIKIRLPVIMIVIVLIAASAGIFFVKMEKLKIADFTTRGGAWKYAVESVVKGNIDIRVNDRDMNIKCNPLFGYGFGKFLLIFPFVPTHKNFNYSNEKFAHAHNDTIEVFWEMGWTGLVFLLSLVGAFIIGFIKSKKSKELNMLFSCIVIYLLNAQGNFLSHLAVSGMLLTIFYGLYEGARRELNGKIPIVA